MISDDFMNNITPVTESGCWLWEGPFNPSGYGYFYVNKKTVSAHRLAYKYFKGDIPQGLQIDHLCRVRCCVNPNHLEAVTQKENILRGIGLTAINSRKTHCKNGHPYTPENTYIKITDNNERCCRICRKAYMKKYDARRKRK